MGVFDAETYTHKFPPTVADSHTGVQAQLTKLIEADQYCNTGNVQYKAVYFPVSMHTETHNLEVLQSYFPGLPEALALPACAPLPLRRGKYQREAKWDVYVNDVKLAFTLTVEYSSQAKAFTGTTRAVAGEVSLKVMGGAWWWWWWVVVDGWRHMPVHIMLCMGFKVPYIQGTCHSSM